MWDLLKGFLNGTKIALHLIIMQQSCILIHMDFDVILEIPGEPLGKTTF